MESSITGIRYSVSIHTCSLSTSYFKRKNVHRPPFFVQHLHWPSEASALAPLSGPWISQSPAEDWNRCLETMIDFALKDLQSFGGCKSAKVQRKRFAAHCSLTNTPCKVTISWTKMASEIVSHIRPKAAGRTFTPQLQGAFTHNQCFGAWWL